SGAPGGRDFRIINHDTNLASFLTDTYTASTTIYKLLNVPYASTTQVTADSLCLTGDTCRTAWPTGGGTAWPFTPSSYNGIGSQSTTTPLWLKNTAIIASTTLFTNASTTGLTVSGNLWLS